MTGVRLRLDGLSSANFARTHHEFQMTLTVGISPTNNASGNKYWIVDPLYKTVEVFRLEENVFGLPEVYEEADQVNVGVFEDLQINLQDVFY